MAAILHHLVHQIEYAVAVIVVRRKRIGLRQHLAILRT